jgi:putative RecB family exonuclease
LVALYLLGSTLATALSVPSPTLPVMSATEVTAEAGGGEPVVPIGVLSPSRASDFLTCPLRSRFRVVDKIPEKPSPEAARGTVVHAVLERLFDLPAASRTRDEAGTLLPPQWEALLAAEPELASLFEDASQSDRFFAAARELLDTYFTLEDPQRLEPAERECYVETPLEGGLVLRGYIDRLDVAAATGDLRIVDYKTGKAPGPGFEARAMFQMRCYALILWRLHGRVPRLLQLLYLGSGEILRYEPDEADLRATERKLLALWAAISRAMDTGDWRPNPSRLCEWCDHQALCPAFGGTPPPLPTRAVPAPVDDEAPSPRSRLAEL